MKSHVKSLAWLAINEFGLMLLLLTLVAAVGSIPAHAQDTLWKADGEHSIARVSLGSVETGVAKVSGQVHLEGNGADPVVNLDIKPEGGQEADYSEISFKSKSSSLTPDNKTAVVGDLTVTRFERVVLAGSPNLGSSDYYGDTYSSEPVVHTSKREVTLLLPVDAQAAAQDGVLHLSTSATITREYFPELLTALAPGNWPTLVVQDESCAMSSGLPSEDYSGASCTGTVVATKTNAAISGTPGIGEGYYGSEPAVMPDLSRATIALDLQLRQVPVSAPAVSTLTGEAGN